MLSPRHNYRGFTIIELLIAISVAGIMLALAVPAMSTWLGNASIRTNAEAVVNGLQFARTEAVRRNTNVRIVLDAAGTSSTVTVVSSGEVIQQRGAEGRASSVVLTFEPAAARTLTFNSLGTITDVAPITAIKVDSSSMAAADSREMCIMVSVSGIARMCDPQRSTANLEDVGATKVTTDPQSCQPAVPAACL